MKCNVRLKNIAAGICLAALSGMAYAGDPVQDIAIPSLSSTYTNGSKSYMLALNDADVAQEKARAIPVNQAAQFEPATFSGSNAHKYMGLTTVALAGLTMLTAPGEGCEQNCPPPSQQPPRQTHGTHANLARAAAFMAAATVTTGLLAHWDDFHVEDGWTDPDNMHAMLGAGGALLMMYAVNKSAKSSVPTSHAAMAELGAAAMVVAIKLTW